MTQYKAISQKLLVKVLIASSICTAIFTLLNYYIEYTNSTKNLESRVIEVVRSTLPNVANAIYNFNTDSLNFQLNGLLQISGITKVEVFEDSIVKETYIHSSEKSQEIDSIHVFDLKLSSDESENSIGSLRVSVTYDDIYQELIDQFVIFFLSQFAKTFLVAYIFLYIFKKHVSIHLMRITSFLSGLKTETFEEDIKIFRYKDEARDELDTLVLMVNNYNTKLKEQIKSIQDLNVGLESMIAKKTFKLEKTVLQLQAAQKKIIQTEKLTSLGELVTNLAHEIQNPINLVVNSSSLINTITREIQTDHPFLLKNVEVVEYLEEVNELSSISEDSGFRISILIKNMLKSNKDKAALDLVDINKLIEFTVTKRLKELQIKYDFPLDYTFDFSKLNRVWAFSDELTRVIQSLISNSFDALEQNKINQQSVGLIQIYTTEDDEFVIINFKDNGPGIPKEIIDKVFEPFFTTKSGTRGTGLGLSLSYDLIFHLHKGEFNILKTSSEGSEIEIKISKNLKFEID
ncbi:hypothetical protein A9Q84_16880 [Halobacteriovorax marinus]|uniref:histidine kinase n=1 Tax=Halobacteriovorax marinus TaxID=97084 RepID=A0A1Y5F4L9_9BACT|nr:hypothetical protein A9Q84_16880 [Halobacteriovorax marinus]